MESVWASGCSGCGLRAFQQLQDKTNSDWSLNFRKGYTDTLTPLFRVPIQIKSTKAFPNRILASQEQYHVTLLFVGNASDAEIARANPTMLRNASAVQELRRRLRRHEGQPVQVEVSDFVWEAGGGSQKM